MSEAAYDADLKSRSQHVANSGCNHERFTALPVPDVPIPVVVKSKPCTESQMRTVCAVTSAVKRAISLNCIINLSYMADAAAPPQFQSRCWYAAVVFRTALHGQVVKLASDGGGGQWAVLDIYQLGESYLSLFTLVLDFCKSVGFDTLKHGEIVIQRAVATWPRPAGLRAAHISGWLPCTPIQLPIQCKAIDLEKELASVMEQGGDGEDEQNDDDQEDADFSCGLPAAAAGLRRHFSQHCRECVLVYTSVLPSVH